MSDAQKRKKRQQKAQSGNNTDSCLWDGCFYIGLGDGCFDIGDSDGCIDLDFDGGCFDIGDSCSMSMVTLPLRIAVILGLMLYGDWDYRNWRAKAQNITKG